jgi:hypothetical protein
MRHPERIKPWSQHVSVKHRGNNISTSISVLIREQHLISRKMYEALFIKKLKPAINAKNEMCDVLKLI